MKESVQQKRRTAPVPKSLLPPCKVCHEPAAGFHYGANTCEACKGFFRRSLLRTEPYKCLGNGNCNIRIGKRKMCPKCRHVKCLAVGMSKEAIKTGRYTHAKRTQNILEYQQMLEESFINSSIASTHTYQSISFQTKYTPVPADCLQTSEAATASQNCVGFNSTSVFGEPYEVLTPLTTYTMMDNFGRVDEANSPCGISTSSLFPLSEAVSRSSFSASLSPVSQLTTPVDGDILDNKECERIVKHLLASHQVIPMPGNKLSPEELQARQLACFEICRLRTEMFGTSCLSEEEYLDVYQKTGLDVDNRQSLLNCFLGIFDETIHRYIAFAKTIPGFTQLTKSDQIRLIKDNLCEFRMMSTFQGYNQQLKVVTMSSGRTECIHELSKVGSWSYLLQRFQCAHAIKMLGLSEDEMVILKSLIIVTVGNEDVDEPEKVSTIQWRIAQCLYWLLKQNRHNPDRIYARIMSRICHVREICVDFYTYLKTQNCQTYTLIQDNALTEWFSDN